jgi:hypothetical protein
MGKLSYSELFSGFLGCFYAEFDCAGFGIQLKHADKRISGEQGSIACEQLVQSGFAGLALHAFLRAGKRAAGLLTQRVNIFRLQSRNEFGNN